MTERVLTARELNRALLARQLLLERSPLPLTRSLERVAGLQTQYAPSGYVSLWSRLRDFHREALTRALEQRRAVQTTLMRLTIHTVSTRDFPVFAAGIRRGRRDWWLGQYRKQLEGVDMKAVASRVREHLAKGPRRADLYGLADGWLGLSAPTEEEGLEHLVRRYLGGFGPASVKDLASWAGLPVRTFLPVVERLPLRRFRDEQGGELVDLPRAPLPDPDTRSPVRFIPTWEAMLLVHARRTQVLPEQYRSLVFNTKTPHSVPTFLVDGAVAGTWRYEGGRVRWEPFEPVPRAARRELEDEARRLAAFHAD